VGIRTVAEFGRRHLWPVTAAGAAGVAGAGWGMWIAVSLMVHGPFIAGYLLAAVCGDVLIYAIGVPALLWLPRLRARTARPVS
jgi:hypothetical protein